MPFIDAKITLNLDAPIKEQLKAELAKTMAPLGKSETYLMVGIDDGYDLWMAGKKLEKGAYVSLSLIGNATKEKYTEVTKVVCSVMSELLSIEPENVYVTYHPVADWGWNNTNF